MRASLKKLIVASVLVGGVAAAPALYAQSAVDTPTLQTNQGGMTGQGDMMGQGNTKGHGYSKGHGGAMGQGGMMNMMNMMAQMGQMNMTAQLGQMNMMAKMSQMMESHEKFMKIMIEAHGAGKTDTQ